MQGDLGIVVTEAGVSPPQIISSLCCHRRTVNSPSSALMSRQELSGWVSACRFETRVLSEKSDHSRRRPTISHVTHTIRPRRPLQCPSLIKQQARVESELDIFFSPYAWTSWIIQPPICCQWEVSRSAAHFCTAWLSIFLCESVGGSIWRRVCLHFASLYRALISEPGPAAPPSLPGVAIVFWSNINATILDSRTNPQPINIICQLFTDPEVCSQVPGGLHRPGFRIYNWLPLLSPSQQTPPHHPQPPPGPHVLFFHLLPPNPSSTFIFYPHFYSSPFLFCLCVF